MSDTPRTDVVQGTDGTIPECSELAEHARQLEKALTKVWRRIAPGIGEWDHPLPAARIILGNYDKQERELAEMTLKKLEAVAARVNAENECCVLRGERAEAERKLAGATCQIWKMEEALGYAEHSIEAHKEAEVEAQATIASLRSENERLKKFLDEILDASFGDWDAWILYRGAEWQDQVQAELVTSRTED